MKIVRLFIGILFLSSVAISCRTSRLKPSVAAKVDTIPVIPPITQLDSLKEAYPYLQFLKENRIDFNTFSGKAKVQFEDENGRQPDAIANIRIAKDSIIWISFTSTFLNIEAVRVLITPQQIIILRKLDKIVETHSFQFVQDQLQMPLTFSDLQNMIVGNPLYLNDSIIGYSQNENQIYLETLGSLFSNLLTINKDNKLLQISRLTDRDKIQNRTALFEFSDYQNLNSINFATYRRILINSELKKAEIRLAFQQYEFNKELSFPFSIPTNYKANYLLL